MRKIHIVAAFSLITGVIAGAGWALAHGSFPVLQPRGSIAREQFDLIIFTSLLSLIIIIPVFALTFYIAWKYRASNKKARYEPEWKGSKAIEAVWWTVPLALIAILSVVIWRSSHDLDPYRPIATNKKPLTVQVIALEWKWLFIYPEQDIASVNYLRIPAERPINFQITADAPMNSFWIPQLGGQVYAMAGMETKLHLQADKPGEFEGMSANLSGEGFADMRFKTVASTEQDFNKWVQSLKANSLMLSKDTYADLAEPSIKHPVTLFGMRDADLYDEVMRSYMTPGRSTDRPQAHSQEGGH